MRLAASLAVLAALTAGAASAAAPKLSFIGQQTLPTASFFAGTQIGGLSGIDYTGGGSFVAISDDRSQINPARFYTLDLALTSTAFSGVTFTKVTDFKTPAGTTYPDLRDRSRIDPPPAERQFPLHVGRRYQPRHRRLHPRSRRRRQLCPRSRAAGRVPADRPRRHHRYPQQSRVRKPDPVGRRQDGHQCDRKRPAPGRPGGGIRDRLAEPDRYLRHRQRPAGRAICL